MVHCCKRFVGCAGAIGVLSCAAIATAQVHTTAGVTQVFDRPLTSTLPMGTHFFTLKREDDQTTLPVKSIVADETSATIGTVTVSVERSTGQPPAAVVTPLANSQQTTAPVLAATNGLKSPPIKVDRSSTAAQELQLAKFERQNKIGEAFLLASQLVKENPDAEFAYDAAIRVSLVLQLQQDVLRFYSDAIAQSGLPGKYYVQLAHYYRRQGMIGPLQKLIADYQKQNAASPEYQLTLCRLFAAAEDDPALANTANSATPTYPVLLLLSRAATSLGDMARAFAALQKVNNAELAPWQARTLLLQLLDFSGAQPGQLLALLEKSLANETDYEKAVQLCDAVLDSMAANHTLAQARRFVDDQASSGTASDVQAFFSARLHSRFQETSEALAALKAPKVGNTPLVALERARLLGEEQHTAEGIQILTTLVQEQPADTPTRVLLAKQAADAGDPQMVLQHLGALDLHKLTGESRREYVTLLTSATAQLHDSGKVVDEWVELAPRLSFPELMSAGDVVLQYFNHKEAWDQLQAAAEDRVEAVKDAWTLHALLARLSTVQGDHQAALDHYVAYLRKDPENIAMLRYVAELSMQNATVPLKLDVGSSTGTLELQASASEGTGLAIDLYRKLIALQPRVSDNYSGLMRSYQLRGEVEAAKRVALEMADRASSSPEACVSAGTILEENGLHPDALVFYRAAVKKDPDNFNAWMRYAGALRKAGKLREAEAIYKRILEEGLHGVPFNQPALVAALLAIAHDNNDLFGLINYIEALRAREMPGKAEFYLTASKLMMQLQQPARAESLLQEFRNTFPDSKLQPEGQLLLGQLLYTRRDLDGARQTFQNVWDKYTSSSAGITAAFNVGEILRQMKRTKEAVDTWESLANRNRTDDKALAALHEASLAAYVELRDVNRAIRLMEQFLESGTLDTDLLNKGRQSLLLMRAGKPIPDYNSASS